MGWARRSGADLSRHDLDRRRAAACTDHRAQVRAGCAISVGVTSEDHRLILRAGASVVACPIAVPPPGPKGALLRKERPSSVVPSVLRFGASTPGLKRPARLPIRASRGSF